jgi:signal transduction histidine kinase
MRNVPPASEEEDPRTLGRQYSLLRRQYLQAIPANARNHRELSELQALATWALRSGLGGWGIVRGGVLRITNRVFDALDRDSIIGPGWYERRPGHERTDADDAAGQGRSLAEIAVAECRLMLAAHQRVRRSLHWRGSRVVELTVETARGADPDDPVCLVHIRDISDVIQAEQEMAALKDRLQQHEQVARAGELAVEVGHDLGNLVGALAARVMVLEAEGGVRGEALTALRNIAEAQAALVARLKAMAQRRRLEHPTPLRLLDEVIKPALLMVESTLHPSAGRASVGVALDPSLERLPLVLASRNELLNLIMNLLVNARDAMPGGGLIRIRGHADERGVTLAVEDEGTGIPEHLLVYVFEPFFTTKGEAGTGMGLAMARQVMRRLGGDMTARNRPGGGACLEMQFPRGAVRPAEIEKESGGRPAGERT